MNDQLLKPMEIIKTRLKDRYYQIGLICLVFSLIFFCISPDFPGNEIDGFFKVLVNYSLSVIYFLVIWISGRLRKGREGLPLIFLWLLLCLISAYALNREMNVFNESTGWFSIALVVFSLNYIAFAFFEAMPLLVRTAMFFILAIAICCFIYLAIYLLPLAAFSLVAFFALGLPLHSFVPLVFVLFSIKLFHRYYRTSPVLRPVFWSSIGFVVVVVASYALYWRVVINQMNNDGRRTEKNDGGLPEWVAVAQRMPVNDIAQKILKSGFVYTVKKEWSNDFLWTVPSTGWNERTKHDPLVMIASALGGLPHLDKADRVRILESLYDSRHQAEERLWSGDDLYTSHVKTEAHIWPRLHIAYTQKTITVADRSVNKRGWWSDQEALYTFHLPEGSVITSLSLWINGKEEKGILTTKAKADTAYKTIVGAERRDPSVVHWQEGNTVTVRVFPVQQGSSRQFKIGITSPLVTDRGNLEYSNIYFDGPSSERCREDVSVTFETPPVDLHSPGMFDREKGLEYSGRYNASWYLSFKDEGIMANVFSFDHKLFSVVPYKKEMAVADLQDIYLDLNSKWTKTEFVNVWALVKGQRLWMYADNKMQRVTEQNRDSLFRSLEDKRFTLFPFFRIASPATALVITKGTAISPSTDELKESGFMAQLKTWLGQSSKVMLYNLGGELSPYLRTLKECRAFRYDHGDIYMLQQLLQARQFPGDIENDNQVVIASANIIIRSVAGEGSSNAPDHLQRLFAYNHIMQKMGPRLLTKGEDGDTLVTEAKAAYVVTPLSSLVVLETQADYDRFNIKDSENSLKNASLHAQGAVPEPHKWALIILVMLVLLYARYRSTQVKRSTAI